MKKLIFCFALVMLAGAGCASSGNAPPTAVKDVDGNITYANVGGRHYYLVVANDSERNTGTKVCTKNKLKCVGYTDTSLNACIAFHPDALTSSDQDGSKAGFYCNGPPQQGVCAQERNTCHICPQCKTNMDCDTQAGTLYNEMFVECK